MESNQNETGDPNQQQGQQQNTPQQGSFPPHNVNTVRVNVQMSRQGAGSNANQTPASSEEAYQAAQAAIPSVLMALARHRELTANGNNPGSPADVNPNLVINMNSNSNGIRVANFNHNTQVNGATNEMNQNNEAINEAVQNSQMGSTENIGLGRNMNINAGTATNNNNVQNSANQSQVMPQTLHIPVLNRMSLSNAPPLPPLKAEPVPIHKRTKNESDSTEKNQTNPIFDCAICFDILEDPTTCSNCTTRYCFKCISRVLALAPSPDNTIKCARCPTCRNSFTSKDLKRDVEFQKFMDKQINEICPHHGCNQLLPLSKLKQHEAECPHILMKCKYAPFGCKWTGPKMHLDHHHNQNCRYHEVSGFIEHYRNEARANRFYIKQMHNQIQVRNQQMQFQHRVISQMQTRKVENIFHILEFGFRCVCYPTTILYEKNIWRRMLPSNREYAIVNNFFVLFPYFILLTKKIFVSITLMIDLCSALFANTTNNNEFEHILDAYIDNSIIIILGFFVGFLYMHDKVNGTSWSPNFINRDLSAISLAAIHFFAISSEPNIVRGYFLSMLLCGLNFLPALISSFSLWNRTSTNIFFAAKATPVVFFGLRYGLILHILGIFGLCEGVILMRLCSQFLRLPPYIEMGSSDCVFSDKFAVATLFVARTVYELCEHFSEVISWNFQFLISEAKQNAKEALFALFIVGCVNMCTGVIPILGFHTGRLIAANANGRIAEERNAMPPRKPRLIPGGVICLCSWIFSLVLIGLAH